MASYSRLLLSCGGGVIDHASETYKYLTGEFKKKTGDAIKCLLNYEESKFSEEDNNLPDYRKFFVKMRDAEPDKYIKRYMYGNCSGTTKYHLYSSDN